MIGTECFSVEHCFFFGRKLLPKQYQCCWSKILQKQIFVYWNKVFAIELHFFFTGTSVFLKEQPFVTERGLLILNTKFLLLENSFCFYSFCFQSRISQCDILLFLEHIVSVMNILLNKLNRIFDAKTQF